jgi:8-oxo-dGTP diphosphatase
VNSELYGRTFTVPNQVLNKLRSALSAHPQGDGVRRAKFILKNGQLTYQAMKRIKNFFDNYNGNDPKQYELSGGDLMKSFIDRTLGRERDAIKRSDNIKRDINIDVNLGVKAQKTPRLGINENDDIENNNNLTGNALAIILNNDLQILLLKRSSEEETWQPDKWALVGGKIEEGETPEQACRREIKEETRLNVENFNQKFEIQRNPNSIEIVFTAKYDGDPYGIELNNEHTNYGWFYPEEIKFLPHVPNLLDYINIAIKDYE